MKNITYKFNQIEVPELEGSFNYVAVCTNCGKFLPFTIRNSIEIVCPEGHINNNSFKFNYHEFDLPIVIECNCGGISTGNNVIRVPNELVSPIVALINNGIRVKAVELNRVVSDNINFRIISGYIVMEVIGYDRATELYMMLKKLNSDYYLTVTDNTFDHDSEASKSQYIIKIFDICNNLEFYNTKNSIDFDLISDRNNRFVKFITEFAEAISQISNSDNN